MKGWHNPKGRHGEMGGTIKRGGTVERRDTVERGYTVKRGDMVKVGGGAHGQDERHAQGGDTVEKKTIGRRDTVKMVTWPKG